MKQKWIKGLKIGLVLLSFFFLSYLYLQNLYVNRFNVLRLSSHTFSAIKKYPEILKGIEIKKKEFRQNVSAANCSRITHFWINLLYEDIFPAWYGTLYDFYGTAEKPYPGMLFTNSLRGRHRKIACGYFVSTILKDMGFNINRVKMGQQAASVIIHSLVYDKRLIRSYSDVEIAKFKEHIEAMGEGIFIVGLDDHVGYIIYNDEGVFFIHSSPVFPYCVVRERIKKAHYLIKSRIKMIGKFSDDLALQEKWVYGKIITINK